MTKEELEKEAEEWIKDHSGLIGSYKFVKYDYDSMRQAFNAGYETMEAYNEKLLNGDIEKHNKIVELEKENAELKEQIENLEGIKLAQGTALEKEYMIKESLKEEKAELKKRNGELAGQKASLNRWLGEAKGIIRSLLFHLNKDTFAVVYENKEESISKAETFLKEFEK